jgi:RNA polymerase sigma-70 factor (ECF subfamily)
MPACPAPWVERIARNEALRVGRRSSLRGRVEGAELDEASAPAAEQDPVAALFGDAFRALSCADQELVRLRYAEDLKYSVIAERLAMPLGTVKVRIHRLHKRLREAPLQ